MTQQSVLCRRENRKMILDKDIVTLDWKASSFSKTLFRWMCCWVLASTLNSFNFCFGIFSYLWFLQFPLKTCQYSKLFLGVYVSCPLIDRELIQCVLLWTCLRNMNKWTIPCTILSQVCDVSVFPCGKAFPPPHYVISLLPFAADDKGHPRSSCFTSIYTFT